MYCGNPADGLPEGFCVIETPGTFEVTFHNCANCTSGTAALEAALEAAAKAGHDTYERLAPDYGYETRPESRIKWDDLPQAHRNLMVVAYTAGVDAYLEALQEDTGRLPMKQDRIDAGRNICVLKCAILEVASRKSARI